MADYGGGSGPSSSSPQICLPPHPPRTNEPHISDSDTKHTNTPNPNPTTDLSIVITPVTTTDITVTPPSSSTGKKPRGRPPGSKNKPKPPTIVTQKDEFGMHVTVLEINSGSNIVDVVHDFARRRGVGMSIITASGAVSSLVLRHSHPTHPTSSSTCSLQGRFDIVNLSATILPTSSSSPSSSSSGFSITVAGPQGSVYGGTVVGELKAAGTVMIVAGTFGKSEFQSLVTSDAGEEQNNKKHNDDGNVDESDGDEVVKPVTVSSSEMGGIAYGNSNPNSNNSNSAPFLFPWCHHTSSSAATPHLHLQQQRF